jgi:plasmid stabilization system protein ParE
MKRYRVRVAREARDDLVRLFRFLAEADESRAQEAVETLALAFESLARLPFASRIAASARDSTLRELIVPFGPTGYVVLFRVTDGRTVSVLAVRHQREEDYH